MEDTWNLMNNWELVIPPSRPSPAQIELLVSIASKIDKKSSVAVLGSTIEYRDILFELNFQNIYIFDRNKRFYELTSKHRIYKNKEILVLGDWIETLQKFPNNFSLIVSDLTSGNVPYKFRNKFYTDIQNALNLGGVFFDKILTHNKKFLNVDILLKKYEKLPINWVTINFFSCELLFCSELLKISEKVDTSNFYKKLEGTSNNQRIKKFIEMSKIITPIEFVWYYGKNWTELKSEYCKNLKLIRTYEDENSSPYFKRVKIFHLEKKNERSNT
jgi:hypothetical protein